MLSPLEVARPPFAVTISDSDSRSLQSLIAFEESLYPAITSDIQETILANIVGVCTTLHLEEEPVSSLGSFRTPLAVRIPFHYTCYLMYFMLTTRLFVGSVPLWRYFCKPSSIPTVDLSVTHLNKETTRPVEGVLAFKTVINPKANL